MKKFILLLIFLWVVKFQLQAQSFETLLEIDLPDTLVYKDLQLVDFDNDSILDVLIASENASDKAVLMIYQVTPNQQMVFQKAIETNITDFTILALDFNNNTTIDIIVSGKMDGVYTSILFDNLTTFNFQKLVLEDFPGALMKYVDVDNDTRREAFIFNESSENEPLLIMLKRTLNTWIPYDTIYTRPSTIEVYDFNKDLIPDLAISGDFKDIGYASIIFSSEGYLNYTQELINHHHVKFSVSDFNHDGSLDLATSGYDNLNNPTNELYYLNTDSSAFTFANQSIYDVFSGDINNDGLSDLVYLQTEDSLAVLLLKDKNEYTKTTLPLLTAFKQTFGDIDRDGDLDIVQLFNSNDIKFRIVKNNTLATNYGPYPVTFWAAVNIYNRFFAAWNYTGDDHTDSNVITYDIHIESEDTTTTPGVFPLPNGRRKLVAHGSVATSRMTLLKPFQNNFDFWIQPVDNAYEGYQLTKCSGSIPGCEQSLLYNDKPVCYNEELTLSTGNEHSYWVSFSKGLLATTDVFHHKAEKADTIFVVYPNENGCAQIEVYNIHFADTAIVKNYAPQYVCENEKIYFSASSFWGIEKSWLSKQLDFISSDKDIMVQLSKDDTVSFYQSDGKGCSLKENFPVVISLPQVDVESNNYQIIAGASVQLQAFGALTYQWTPVETLDNANIPNPVANPLITTTYTVTGMDSSGCKGIDSVQVIVGTTAFVPSLFTPNDDGKNDGLRVFGLENVKDFHFYIYNRVGVLVYSSGNVNEVTNRGWDGTTNGAKQPAGIYFWKVEGVNQLGNTLQLNGKVSGSLVLIR